MVNIYIKLGTASEWHDERLNFHLDSNHPKGFLDYSNLTEEIFAGLIALEIVQIDVTEFNGIADPPPPIIVNSNDLISITAEIGPCPNPDTIFFARYQGVWYKVLWSTIKECASGGAQTLFKFRVGDSGLPAWAPSDGDSSFIPLNGVDPMLADIIADGEWDKLLITLNSVELYHKSTYTNQGDDADFNWYDIDLDTGEFSTNLALATKDIMIARKI
jgi:hypothetical protein